MSSVLRHDEDISNLYLLELHGHGLRTSCLEAVPELGTQTGLRSGVNWRRDKRTMVSRISKGSGTQEPTAIFVTHCEIVQVRLRFPLSDFLGFGGVDLIISALPLQVVIQSHGCRHGHHHDLARMCVCGIDLTHCTEIRSIQKMPDTQTRQTIRISHTFEVERRSLAKAPTSRPSVENALIVPTKRGVFSPRYMITDMTRK